MYSCILVTHVFMGSYSFNTDKRRQYCNVCPCLALLHHIVCKFQWGVNCALTFLQWVLGKQLTLQRTLLLLRLWSLL